MFPLFHGILSHVPEAGPPPSGWWDDNGNISGALAAWQAKGAASYAASLLDLTGNGHTLVERNGTVPWSAEAGWEFVAADLKSLDTMIVPSDGYSVLVQFANAQESFAGTLLGIVAPVVGNHYFLIPILDSNHTYGIGTDPGNNNRPGNLSAGNMGMAGYDCFKDGAADGSVATGTFSWSLTMTIGAGKRRDAEVLVGFWVTADIIAVAIYDTVLSAGDMATIAANMAAL